LLEGEVLFALRVLMLVDICNSSP